ncbi:unnamed protein product, partial [marine sediment metagenome]
VFETGSGLFYTEYSYDGITWSLYTTPLFEVNEGTTEIHYRSFDIAGNMGIVKIESVRIDNTPPITTISIEGNLIYESWYDLVPSITLAATDTISGINISEYSLDGINWITYNGPFNVFENGIVTINYKSKDDAGNTEITKFEILKIVLTSIIIDEEGNGDYTWEEAVDEEWCSGSGTWSDPYIIQNLVIDGKDTGTCLLIRNSNVPFVVKNCRIYNAGSSGAYYAGIYLYKTSNGKIINNTIGTNMASGIYLMGFGEGIVRPCINNSIINNTIKDTSFCVSLTYSNIISYHLLNL